MRLITIWVLLMFSVSAFGNNRADDKSPQEVVHEAVVEQENREEPKLEDSSGNGISSWNLSFGLGVEQYRDPYIKSASIHGEEKIVMIDESVETLPSAWLTLNWNLGNLYRPYINVEDGQVKKTKWGLFAGVKIIDSNAESFGAFSLGPQLSFITNKRVVSVGFGWVTHKTKVLGSGINAGEALPSHLDDVVFEEGTENSYMLMMSVKI